MVQFLDKIEGALRDTPFRNLIQGVYGGKIATYVKCKKCGNVRESKEVFNNITLDVVGVEDIYQSLQKYTTGEHVDDYTCEACK